MTEYVLTAILQGCDPTGRVQVRPGTWEGDSYVPPTPHLPRTTSVEVEFGRLGGGIPRAVGVNWSAIGTKAPSVAAAYAAEIQAAAAFCVAWNEAAKAKDEEYREYLRQVRERGPKEASA